MRGMALSEDQLRSFGEGGCIVLRGVIDDALLAAADAEIEALSSSAPPPAGLTGKHFWFTPPAQLPACAATFFGSPARAIAEELTAPLALELPFDHVQVALNIPPNADRPGGGHIDGHVRLTADQRDPYSFTLLAGVYLSDEIGPPHGTRDSGSLWVWPGSHLAHQDWFATHGPHALMDNGGHLVMCDDAPDLGPARVLHGRRGDLLLAHYLLAHNTGSNLTASTRRMLYFRLAAVGHRERWASTFTDAFCEFAPVRAAMSR